MLRWALKYQSLQPQLETRDVFGEVEERWESIACRIVLDFEVG